GRLLHHLANAPDDLADLKPDVALAAVARTLQDGRESLDYRLAFPAGSMAELIGGFEAFLRRDTRKVHLGDAKRGARFSALLDGAEGRQFLQDIVANGSVDKLAAVWASGVDFDWRAIRPRPWAPIVHLPHYPFLRERCWMPALDNDSTAAL